MARANAWQCHNRHVFTVLEIWQQEQYRYKKLGRGGSQSKSMASGKTALGRDYNAAQGEKEAWEGWQLTNGKESSDRLKVGFASLAREQGVTSAKQKKQWGHWWQGRCRRAPLNARPPRQGGGRASAAGLLADHLLLVELPIPPSQGTARWLLALGCARCTRHSLHALTTAPPPRGVPPRARPWPGPSQGRSALRC